MCDKNKTAFMNSPKIKFSGGLLLKSEMLAYIDTQFC